MLAFAGTIMRTVAVSQLGAGVRAEQHVGVGLD
jgi:hypothetical protein